MNKFKISVLALGLVGTLSTVSAFAAGEAGSANPNQDIQALQARQAAMDSLFNQNNSSLIDQDPSLGANWFNRIKISGVLSVDAGYSSTTAGMGTLLPPGNMNVLSGYGSNDSSYMNLADSQIDVDAQVNNMVRAHVSLADRDDNARQDALNVQDNLRFLDEAYITFGDFTRSPVMATLGRQYVPFGNYQRHEITPTVVADLSETQATAAKVGFVSQGLVGSLYMFNGMNAVTETNSGSLNNGGFSVDYNKEDQKLGFSLGVAYLYNMMDVDLIHDLMQANGGTYSDRVDAMSAHARVNTGPFAGEVDYVAALQSFNQADLPFSIPAEGAKPTASNFELDYTFQTAGYSSMVLASYQHTTDASALGEPHNRYVVGYNVGLLKNTDLKLQYKRDQNYDSEDGAVSGSNGSLADHSNQVDARISVRF